MYAKVIVDIAHANVDRLFTYSVPEDCRGIRAGHHVLVPFGSSRTPKEGFVISLSEDAPEGISAIKDILRIIEPYPVLLPDQLALAEWIRNSYHCLLVDALRLMIPPQLRGSRVHAKVIRTVSLNPERDPDEMLQSLLTKGGTVRSKKQYAVLKFLIETGLEMTVDDIAAVIPDSRAAIKALSERGYILENGRETFRRPNSGMNAKRSSVSLTDAQQNAVAQLSDAMENDPKTFLLFGVTGSGKTEVYMHAIEHCLALGRQAIMLVPEISLTPQTVGLFYDRFGDRIAVLHSRLSPGERFDEWRRIRLGYASVVVGARSAIFAPLNDIGLIIIDEEHEASYQSETTPRYQALDVAAKRAGESRAVLLLGSATPSLLSYFRAEHGRYTLLTLPERVNSRPMPTVEIVDMREEFLAGNNGIFSAKLIRHLAECLKSGQQAMLFLNRRGYSTFVSCRACGHVMLCENCDISMTYHKGENRMRCHFCGASAPLPATCPNCGKPFIKYFGIGTEQVEEQLHKCFPSARTLRMDTDTVRGKDSMQSMLNTFARGEADVLIGTQMIAKGHDFPNVTLVGVVAADASLCIPDYRSAERTFDLLTQVSGRAGRDTMPGRVVVQTYSPSHPAIRFAKGHDYVGFYRYELSERKKALFPPFSLFIRVLFSGTDDDILRESAVAYAKGLEAEVRSVLGDTAERELLLYCCSPCQIHRKQGMYRWQILIKLFRTAKTADVIRTVYRYSDEHRSELFAAVEINPQDML